MPPPISEDAPLGEGDATTGAVASWERAWTVQEMRDQCTEWNLAGDSGLLNHLTEFSQRLVDRTKAYVLLCFICLSIETTTVFWCTLEIIVLELSLFKGIICFQSLCLSPSDCV